MRSTFTFLVFAMTVGFSPPLQLLGAELQYTEPDVATGLSSAVVVPESWGLIQTTQLFPLGKEGALLGGETAAGQLESLLGVLQELLVASGSGMAQLVRLHVYAANDEAAAAVRKVIAARFAETSKPAATFVITSLPHPKVLVAIDAIAATSNPPADGKLRPVRIASVASSESVAHSVVVPSGTMVFISGQAETGDLSEATRKTMQSLHETLKFLGLGAADVVQVKTFLRPMTETAVVEKEIAAFYPGLMRPPVTHVEWTYSAPIEIEMIAVGKKSPQKPADPVRYLAPPHLKQSPVFSRLTVTEGAPLVFVSGFAGTPGTSGDEQNAVIFERLQKTLKLSKSDLRHLAKATYYASDDAPSNALNTIRTRLYDPQRPPAASKAGVKGVAANGAGLVVDMIATQVPAP